jgi:hypothetical protein
VVNEKRGTFQNGKEFHRVDMVVDTEEVYTNRRVIRQLLVQFLSGDGEYVRLPKLGTPVNITVSVSASKANNRWFNNVKALQFEEITFDNAANKN